MNPHVDERPTVFPGAVYIIASWYRQYEVAHRVSIFYMSALLSSGFGGIVRSLMLWFPIQPSLTPPRSWHMDCLLSESEMESTARAGGGFSSSKA
jgi:hypothetical protein